MKKIYILLLGMLVSGLSFGQSKNATIEEEKAYLEYLNSKSTEPDGTVSLKSSMLLLSNETTFNYTGSFETYTVPPGVTSINIVAFGAQGASGDPSYIGGKGAKMSGDFTVTPGDVLIIAVGGKGQGQSSYSNGGGGGGTFVVRKKPTGAYTFASGPFTGTSFDLLVIAGGGGGTRYAALQNGNPGVISQQGTTGSLYYQTGGGLPNSVSLGSGGLAPIGSWGSAGGGLTGNGANDYSYGFGGSSFINGAAGGTGGTGGGDNAAGGFGGGGQGRGWYGGGGGGGYTGGDGGLVAGGGGSYNTGMTQNNIAGINSGSGKVIITILCPEDITVNNDVGQCGAIVDYNTPSGTQTAGLPSGSVFPVGTTTNTFNSGCSFTVTVNDNEAPAIVCPSNIISDNDPGDCGAIINYNLPTVIDNCPSATLAGFTTLGVFEGNRYYLSNALFVGPDAFANAITKGGFVASINSAAENAFVRNAATLVAGGINILIGFNDAATEGTFAWQNGDPVTYTNWNGGEPNDLGGEDYTQILATGKWNDVPGSFYTYRYILKLKGTLLVQTAGLPSGSSFPGGTTTNTFVVTDAAGNTASCSFTVTVNDTEAPTVNDPAAIVVNNDVDQCGAVVCYPAPVASDNCRPATPAGYNFLNSYGNSYYYQSNVLSNYATAVANAVVAGGHLAVITSAAENAAIAAGGGTFSYIGGDDLANDGTFTWSNCEIYSYSNFGGGEPNGGLGENYLEFMGGGYWNDINENNPRYAILEIEGASVVQTAGLPANSVFPIGTTTNTFVVTDAAGNTATCSFDVTVIDNQAPAINCSANIVVDNDPGICGAVVTYSVSSSDNCPGQSVEQTAGLASGSVFPVGTTTNTFVVTDAAGNTATCSFTVTVNDTEVPTIVCATDIIADNDPALCGAVVTYSVSSDDNCPGQTVTQAAGLTSGSVFPVGTTTNTFVVTDASGNSATCSFTVTVNNTLPVVTIVTGPATPIALGNSIGITISHNDNNLTNSAIDWDDLSPVQNVVNPSIGSFAATHTYATPGVYTVSVNLTDACGEISATYLYQYVVIYDPNGGFVTGGGWFSSPECAYKLATGVTGKANFGFVAKYKKGSTVPDGNTEFQFKAGDINFHSSIYDDMRLVIANYKANYTGTGTINGTGNYGFLVSAIDGQIKGDGIDKFRIKIWDKNNGNNVVYDNNCLDTDENSDPVTAINGGSIVIHSAPKNKSAEIATAIEPEVGLSEMKAYPNPFSDKLFFEFSREEDTKATLILFDGVGRKISVLFDQQIQANQNYRIEYVPNGLSTNMLFYRMTFGDKVINGKVVYRK